MSVGGRGLKDQEGELLLWMDKQSEARGTGEGGSVSQSKPVTEPGPLCILYCGLTASVKENKIGHLQILTALYFVGGKPQMYSYIYFLYNFSYRVKYYTTCFSENN